MALLWMAAVWGCGVAAAFVDNPLSQALAAAWGALLVGGVVFGWMHSRLEDAIKERNELQMRLEDLRD